MADLKKRKKLYFLKITSWYGETNVQVFHYMNRRWRIHGWKLHVSSDFARSTVHLSEQEPELTHIVVSAKTIIGFITGIEKSKHKVLKPSIKKNLIHTLLQEI